jgi:hypothetical protein
LLFIGGEEFLPPIVLPYPSWLEIQKGEPMTLKMILKWLAVLGVCLLAAQVSAGDEQKLAYPSMPGPGKKVPVGSDHYLIYGFDKKPKLGTVIMKVEIFTREGKKDTSIEAKADAGMPSMKGAHETGERPTFFQ